jgi:hypothetical protein
MTEGFAFGYDDGEECDETTEEDLLYLNDPVINYNTAVIIKFFYVYIFFFILVCFCFRIC